MLNFAAILGRRPEVAGLPAPEPLAGLSQGSESVAVSDPGLPLSESSTSDFSDFPAPVSAVCSAETLVFRTDLKTKSDNL